MAVPQPAERLQHQRITSPSRLKAEGSSPQGMQRVQQVQGLDLSTANVPTSAATAAPTPSRQQGAPSAKQQLHAEAEARPSTAPAAQLRVSTFSLASLNKPPSGDGAAVQPLKQDEAGVAGSALSPRRSILGSSIAADAPRVRQQVLRNFAGAVPAVGAGSGSGGTSPLGSTPRPALYGERPASAAGGHDRRPSTPSFQPLALPRPSTALGGPAGNDAGFSIKAGQGKADAGKAGAMDGKPQGAYPKPPQTAPSKAAAAGPPGAPAAPAPGSLASFGISSAAFVAAPGKPGGAAQQGGPGQLMALTQAAMLASAAFTTKAELRRFLLTPGPADKPLCCKILRTGGGLLRGGPQYSLLVEQEGGRTGAFLLAARKCKGGPAGSTFVLSVDQHEVSRHSASYIGKLRSNFMGTEFVAYDAGSKGEGSGKRCELGAVQYQTNVLGTKGPRKMTVIIPKLEPGGSRPLLRAPAADADTLLGQYKSYALSSCVVLRNKPPRWNQAMSAYCLNFGGRVTQASVKNFQLVSVDNMERTILQFGKVAADAFTMDFCYPMTALQAFSVCLSSMASKLACE